MYMSGLFKKIQSASHNRTSYRVGLLQAKAYRILKNYTGKLLAAYELSTVDWALLGLLHDHPKGMRSSILAQELGVEAPFITSLFGKLNTMGLVESKRDEKDSRAKILSLTAKGASSVEKIEKELRSAMKPLLSGSSIGDLLSYVSVLETIIENAKK